MAASGGSPTLTAAPVRLTPRKNLRLLRGMLPPLLSYFIIIVQSLQKLGRTHQRDQQVFEVEPGFPEFHEKLMDGLLVRTSFQMAIRIAENVPHDAFLTYR